MDNQTVTALEVLEEAKSVRAETLEMMQRIKDEQAENAKLLELSQKSILLALGQTITLEPKDYQGSLMRIAEQLASESGQLAANLRKRNKPNISTGQRNCHDAMLGIMQLAMLNHDVLYIHANYSPNANCFDINAAPLGCRYEQSSDYIYTFSVYVDLDEDALEQILAAEDKLIELIAEAKDKVEVAA
ncbi:hypothetical protein L4C36_22715 [Photobacterium japonica]|uniref:hypothetical protein n=1 Tax=Photobacterium japonica TaxID=2910235 RepID=UPI003D0FB37D